MICLSTSIAGMPPDDLAILIRKRTTNSLRVRQAAAPLNGLIKATKAKHKLKGVVTATLFLVLVSGLIL